MNPPRLPNEEEWVAWLQLPQTQALQRLAAERRLTLMESWAGGSFSDDMALNNKALGECQAYAILEELDFQTVIVGQLGETDGQVGAKPGD